MQAVFRLVVNQDYSWLLATDLGPQQNADGRLATCALNGFARFSVRIIFADRRLHCKL